MRIQLQFSDDVAIVRLSGKFLAGSDGPFLRQKVTDLISAGTRKLIVDFSEVPYIDSTGLGFLAGARTTAQESGVDLVLSSLNLHVKKVLEGVQMSKYFVIAKDENAALGLLREGAESQEQQRPGPAKGAKGKKRSQAADE